MAYQIKAYGKLVYADILKIQNSGKKTIKILHLASILYIPESHAVDRPLSGEFYDNKVVSELHFGAICHFGCPFAPVCVAKLAFSMRVSVKKTTKRPPRPHK